MEHFIHFKIRQPWLPKLKVIRTLRILLADDNIMSFHPVEWFFRKRGHEVTKVYDGYAALEFCRNNPDVDLVMMDILMPVMGGIESTENIRQFNKDVIKIAMVADNSRISREEIVDAGCNDVISKPIDLELLLSVCSEHLNYKSKQL